MASVCDAAILVQDDGTKTKTIQITPESKIRRGPPPTPGATPQEGTKAAASGLSEAGPGGVVKVPLVDPSKPVDATMCSRTTSRTFPDRLDFNVFGGVDPLGT